MSMTGRINRGDEGRLSMTQLSFLDMDYGLKKRKTRREVFLEKMDALIPWHSLIEQIQPHYHGTRDNGRGGRPAWPLELMLRIHMVQLFYNLSDPGMEDALYEINSIRRFVGLNRFDRGIPDETSIMRFRHLLEKHDLGQKLFEQIREELTARGLYFREGTMVDATIIQAPGSTKNQSRTRDPEMASTCKGNQYYFGMKLHIGADSGTGLIHSLHTTSANVHDITVADRLLHGEEKHVHADAGYLGMDRREEHGKRKVSWHIAVRRSQRKMLNEAGQQLEKLKASIRAKVEHPFAIIKRQFGYGRVRYRGLKKNTNRLYVLSALANLLLADRFIRRGLQGQCA